MSNQNHPSCLFKNESVTFESYIDVFTPELYKEFDLLSAETLRLVY